MRPKDTTFFMLSAMRNVFDWIPAFAGMTSKKWPVPNDTGPNRP
jgi:hypothetical protein